MSGGRQSGAGVCGAAASRAAFLATTTAHPSPHHRPRPPPSPPSHALASWTAPPSRSSSCRSSRPSARRCVPRGQPLRPAPAARLTPSPSSPGGVAETAQAHRLLEAQQAGPNRQAPRLSCTLVAVGRRGGRRLARRSVGRGSSRPTRTRPDSLRTERRSLDGPRVERPDLLARRGGRAVGKRADRGGGRPRRPLGRSSLGRAYTRPTPVRRPARTRPNPFLDRCAPVRRPSSTIRFIRIGRRSRKEEAEEDQGGKGGAHGVGARPASTTARSPLGSPSRLVRRVQGSLLLPQQASRCRPAYCRAAGQEADCRQQDGRRVLVGRRSQDVQAARHRTSARPAHCPSSGRVPSWLFYACPLDSRRFYGRAATSEGQVDIPRARAQGEHRRPEAAYQDLSPCRDLACAPAVGLALVRARPGRRCRGQSHHAPAAAAGPRQSPHARPARLGARAARARRGRSERQGRALRWSVRVRLAVH